MNKPTIGIIVPNLNSGGAQRVLSTLSNELVADYNVLIITLAQSEPFYKLANEVECLFLLNQIPPSTNLFQAVRNNYKLISRLIRLVSGHQVDIILSFLTTANILSLIVAKIMKIPIIICERNNPNLDKVNKFWDILRKITYRWSNRLIVQSKLIKSFYDTWISDEKIEILPNPISRSLSDKRDGSVRKEKIILNVGRLTPQKGQEMLISAFAKTKNDDWKLIIIGEGEKRLEYEQLILKLNLTNKVELLGQQKNIHEYYNKASIFAFTSIYEGFPNALIEAMHFGLPCISMDCPTGPSDLIINNCNGFLIPVGDVTQFSIQLENLMQNSRKRLKFSQKAPNAVLNYDSSTVILQWQKIIRDVLA